MRQTLQKIDDGLCGICGFIVAAAIASLILLNFAQLITRYVISYTFTWAEEVSTLTIIYATAFGAPWVTLKRRHLRMDAATKLLPQSVKNVTHWIAHGLILITAVLYIYIGTKTVAYNTGFTMSILGFDESLRYLPLIGEGVLISVAELITLAEDILDAKSGKLVIK